MTLTRGEWIYAIACILAILLGGTVWAWAAGAMLNDGTGHTITRDLVDDWPVVTRTIDGEVRVVMPEDLDRPR